MRCINECKFNFQAVGKNITSASKGHAIEELLLVSPEKKYIQSKILKTTISF